MTRKRKPVHKLLVPESQVPRWQREKTLSLLVWVLVPLIILACLILVSLWAYNTYVGVWNQRVSTVNETTIDMRDYVKMLRFSSRATGQPVGASSFPYQVVRDMEDAELARQKAQALGIGVPPETVTETIDDVLLASDPSGGNLTLTQRGETYHRWLEYVQLSETEYRRIIETDLLREELLEYFKEQEVPPEAEQVHLLTIARDSEEEAHAALRQLLSGNATTAQELLQGDRGWVPRGIYPELDGYAFDLGAGNTSQPVQTLEGYSLIKVTEVDDSRAIDDQHRQIIGARAFDDWLTEARLDGVVGYLNDDMIDWATGQIE